MPSIEPGSFGLAIAFMAPGVLGLWGVGEFVPTIREWFGASAQTEPTGAGFLFVLLASLALGLVISGVRQEILDGVVFRYVFRITRPNVSDSALVDPNVLSAVKFASDNLYRYYQFYGNMLFAILLAYGAWVIHDLPVWEWSGWRLAGAAGVVAAIVLLTLSARYSLARYYRALQDIMGREGASEQRLSQIESAVDG